LATQPVHVTQVTVSSELLAAVARKETLPGIMGTLLSVVAKATGRVLSYSLKKCSTQNGAGS
jgi:hypothetical protein